MGTLIEKLTEIRAREPEKIAQALANRTKAKLADNEKIMVIACDHPARGALGAGSKPMAMENREDLLARCVTALSRPGVNGFLGTADLIEDLTLLGALDGKLVWGSMNRVGIQGTCFEMDDRFAGYDACGIENAQLNGGKMLMRINYSDKATAATLESCAQAIDSLAERGLNAMVEPFISEWVDGKIRNTLTPEAVIKSIAITAGLGRTSAYTWLKLPCVEDMERVMESTTLPSLILGGEVSKDPEATRAAWGKALSLPNVRGLVIGRSVLYPADGDVAQAVDSTVAVM